MSEAVATPSAPAESAPAAAAPVTTPVSVSAGAPKPAESADAKPAEAAPADAKPVAEGDYKPFTPPKGFEKLDETLVAEFLPIAKAHKLSQEDAQKFVDLAGTVVEQTLAAQKSALDERVEQWTATVQADKELGGDALPENLNTAYTAVMKFGGKPLLDALVETRLENHPEIIRAFVRVGRAMKDDNFSVSAGDAGGEKPSVASLLYNSDGSPRRQ